MTRIRVLQRAIRLLQSGFIPYDRKGQARDINGNIVTCAHPDACQFNATGAVVRAIYEFTGDPVQDRLPLWESTMKVFHDRYKGWTPMYNAFEKMSKAEIIDLFQQQLDEWNDIS